MVCLKEHSPYNHAPINLVDLGYNLKHNPSYYKYKLFFDIIMVSKVTLDHQFLIKICLFEIKITIHY